MKTRSAPGADVYLQYAVLVVALLLSGSAVASPPAATPFLLQRGAIVDVSRGSAYIAAPGRSLDAVDLGTGRTSWSSTEAALPIGANGTFVVGQVEDTAAAATLKLVVLDSSTGRRVSAASVNLPAGVSALVSDGFTSRFRATAAPSGALFLVSWLYLDDAADPDEDPSDPPLRQFAGSFRLSPQDGRVSSVSGGPVAQLPENLASYDTDTPQPWKAGNVSARVVGSDKAPFVLKRTETGSGRPLPDVVVSQRAVIAIPSRDQRHFAVVESVGAGGTEWPGYRLRVFATDTADQVTEFQREISATPFFVFGDSIVMISPSRISYRAGVSTDPLSISTVRLTTGVQQWRVELRDLAFHGPMPPARREAKAELESREPLHATVSSLPTTGGGWSAQGPAPINNGQVEGITNGPVVGAVNSIVQHPTNPDIIWIGTVNGGIWKTENASSSSPSWVPLTDTLSSLSFGLLSYDMTDLANSRILVAAAGATSSFGFSLQNTPANGPLGGIIRTTDSGNSWTVLNALAGKNISGLVARGSVIVASTWGDAPGFRCGGKLYRSTDTGGTFAEVTGVSGTVFDVKGSNPSQNDVLYAASHVCGASGSGIYKSIDRGASWSRVSISSAALENELSDANVDNAKMAVSLNRVVVGIVIGGQLHSLFASSDGGANWTQLDTPSALNPGGQGRLNFSIAIDIWSTDILVYVGGDVQPYPFQFGATDATGRLFRVSAVLPAGQQAMTLTHCSACNPKSTNNNSAPHADSRFLTTDAGGNLLEADDGGIYRRTNPTGVGDWYSVNGNLQITEAHDVAWDHVSHRIISGNQDTGVTEQTGIGSTAWNTVLQYGIAGAGDGADVGVNGTSSTTFSARWSSHPYYWNPTRRVMNQSGGVVLLSTPTLHSTGSLPSFPFYPPVELNRIDATRMLIGGVNNLYESHDEAENITPLYLGPEQIIYGAMVYGSQDSLDSFYAITKTAGSAGSSRLYVRKSGTDPVTEVTTGPWEGEKWLNDVTSDPGNSRRAYVIYSKPRDGGGTDPKVYETTDAGTSWTDVTGDPNASTTSAGGPLTNADIPDVRTIVFIPGSPSRIAVGGLYGVFQMAIDAPGVWKRLGSGLPNAVVYDLDYDLTEDVLVAGTMGRGVFKLSDVGGSATPPTAPTGVSAAATTSTNVHVQWTQSSGATSYKIYRNAGSGYSVAGTAGATDSSFDDSGATGNNAYLYKVTAVNSGGESAASNVDLATTVMFTNTIAHGAHVMVADFTELLTAVNAVRRLADPAGTTYPAISFTAPAPASNISILAAHLRNLRDGLDPARTALQLGPIGYDDPTITSGSTVIKVNHINQLRWGVQ